MKLALCMIVKDDSEIKGLDKAVRSLIKYVDKIFITTTGKEVSKIKEYCGMVGLMYSHRDWDYDFSAARNFNFDQAIKHDEYDYLLWIDADDIFIGGEHLRAVAENAKRSMLDIVFFTYWYGVDYDGEPLPENMKEVELEHMRERLIRPGTNIWKSRLHETPVPVPGYEPKYSKYPYDAKQRPIAIMHTMDKRGDVDKMMRNKEILEMQLKEERERGEADPRTLLYLMKIYAEVGSKELCEETIKMGHEYLEKSGWAQERGVCWEQMGLAYALTGDEVEANMCFHKAIEEHPYQVLFYIRLAQSYFNLKKYNECEHWMKVGTKLDIDNTTGDQTNLKAIKVGYAELLVNLNWNVKRDVKKALEAATMLYKEHPTDNNKQNMDFIHDAYDLNEACRNVDELSKYLHSIGEDKSIIEVLEKLPIAITRQPFAMDIRKKFTAPRRWGKDEICYFANFGGAFIEKWDARNLEKGIGGSETAVIELSKEWAKLGWKVTVYGDPEKPGVDEFGINWLPWYYFNQRDLFNIFIQWRSWEIAGRLKCKKFYVDLHDICNGANLLDDQLTNIDGFFFKTKAHRDLVPKIPDSKAFIVGNGVRYAQS